LALEAGAELWQWQHGDPALTVAAPVGIAIMNKGEIITEWWLRLGTLADYVGIPWAKRRDRSNGNAS